LPVPMTAVPKAIALPVGASSWSPLSWHEGLSPLGENPVRFWTSDDGASSVVRSLEAWSLETQLSFSMMLSHVRLHSVVEVGGMVQDGELQGVAKLLWRRSHLWWWPGLSHFVSSWLFAVDCGGWRCLVIVSWCAAASVDGACGNDIVWWLALQWIVVGSWALPNYTGVVHRRRTALATSLVCQWFVHGWSNEVMLILGGGLAIRWGSRWRGNSALLPDGELRYRFVTWSVVACVASPPCAVFLRGDEMWSPATGEVRPPCVCAVMVVTARQPARSSDLVFSLHQVGCGVAGAPRRRVLHGGGFVGVVRSAFFWV
jgi:hypothetical protein